MSFLKILIFGIIIGIAAIMPGLSGGVLAISLGIYPMLISSVTNLRKNFKESITFLIPYAVGAGIGMLIFGVVMKPLLQHFERSVIWLFVGLIVGSIPSLLKEATSKGFKVLYLLPFIISFGLGMCFTSATAESNLGAFANFPVMMFIGGGILALGAIIPGISSSVILMQMGMYDKIISSFVSLNWINIIFIALGAIAFFVGTIKLVNWAFSKFHGYAYFAAFGFLLSTVVAVCPKSVSVADALIFAAGVISVCLFKVLTDKYNLEK